MWALWAASARWTETDAELGVSVQKHETRLAHVQSYSLNKKRDAVARFFRVASVAATQHGPSAGVPMSPGRLASSQRLANLIAGALCGCRPKFVCLSVAIGSGDPP